MGSKYKHRVKKLEQKFNIKDNPVTKITKNFISADGKVSSSITHELIDGVWCEETEEVKSTN